MTVYWYGETKHMRSIIMADNVDDLDCEATYVRPFEADDDADAETKLRGILASGVRDGWTGEFLGADAYLLIEPGKPDYRWIPPA